MNPIDIQVRLVLNMKEEEQLNALKSLAVQYGWTQTVKAIFIRYAEFKYR